MIQENQQAIYIIGDSTAAEKTADKRPETGWGEYIADYLEGSYEIHNHAVNGRSTLSFLAEGLFDAVENQLKAGDYLIIQFGHNDQKKEDPSRYADPYGSYQDHIRHYVDRARQKGATPIILSSITRRDFIDGQVNADILGEYPRSAMRLASELDLAHADIFKKTQAYISQLGEDESKSLYLHLEAGAHPNYPDGISDNTHLNVNGAKKIAELIAEELNLIL